MTTKYEFAHLVEKRREERRAVANDIAVLAALLSVIALLWWVF